MGGYRAQIAGEAFGWGVGVHKLILLHPSRQRTTIRHQFLHSSARQQRLMLLHFLPLEQHRQLICHLEQIFFFHCPFLRLQNVIVFLGFFCYLCPQRVQLNFFFLHSQVLSNIFFRHFVQLALHSNLLFLHSRNYSLQFIVFLLLLNRHTFFFFHLRNLIYFPSQFCIFFFQLSILPLHYDYILLH